jgi:2-C-methyl-D-erythritol 2,4-cyclodiphosphate synthase
VAVHDAARPLVTPRLISRVVAAARAQGAAIPALPIEDTIKRAAEGLVEETVDRRALFLSQTPQVFAVDLLRRAFAARRGGAREPTDEAQLVAETGHPVTCVAGEPANFKITVPADLALAEAVLAGMGAGRVSPLVGHGYDVHRLVVGRPLVLGGISLPGAEGLLGHSDADVLCHALADALLGAACLGDLGAHFPDGDPSLRGISGVELLERVREELDAAGLQVGNVDTTIVCERPRLAPFIPEMRAALGRALGMPVARVSVKATTSEGLGFAGRQEGIAAYATAVLVPRRQGRDAPLAGARMSSEVGGAVVGDGEGEGGYNRAAPLEQADDDDRSP